MGIWTSQDVKTDGKKSGGGRVGSRGDGGGVDAQAFASVSRAASCRDLGSTKARWVTQRSGRVPASDGILTVYKVKRRIMRYNDDDGGRQARNTASV